jgi:hypothetical protein
MAVTSGIPYAGCVLHFRMTSVHLASVLHLTAVALSYESALQSLQHVMGTGILTG